MDHGAWLVASNWGHFSEDVLIDGIQRPHPRLRQDLARRSASIGRLHGWSGKGA
jgi:hypothetical protein